MLFAARRLSLNPGSQPLNLFVESRGVCVCVLGLIKSIMCEADDNVRRCASTAGCFSKQTEAVISSYCQCMGRQCWEIFTDQQICCGLLLFCRDIFVPRVGCWSTSLNFHDSLTLTCPTLRRGWWSIIHTSCRNSDESLTIYYLHCIWPIFSRVPSLGSLTSKY